MYQEIVRVAAVVGNLPHCGGNIFGFLARIRENNCLLALDAVVNIFIARVDFDLAVRRLFIIRGRYIRLSAG